MKNLIFIFFLMIAIKAQLFASEHRVSISPKLVEVVLCLPFEELIIGSEGISVNYEGSLLAIHSLERHGGKWIVRTWREEHEDEEECPNGHTIVCPCGGCAISSCPYCCSNYSDFRVKSS